MSYFPIFIDMTDRQVLVVGAGSVASRRVGVLEKFGAAITVIAPNTSEEIRKLADSRKIRLIEQTYEEVRDTIWQEKNFFMALAATGQTGTDARIKEDASSHSVWFNMASDKSQSEFYFPAIARQRTDSRIDFWRSGSGIDASCGKRSTPRAGGGRGRRYLIYFIEEIKN